MLEKYLGDLLPSIFIIAVQASRAKIATRVFRVADTGPLDRLQYGVLSDKVR
jgi:hypothetical protein